MGTSRAKVRRVALAGTWVTAADATHQPEHDSLALATLQAYTAARLDGVALSRSHWALPLGANALPGNAVDSILASDPEVVGISSYCWDREAFGRAITEIKQRSPSTQIIVGGPTATYAGRDLMRGVPGVDVAVRGEGEATFVDLLSGGLAGPSGVEGILYRDGDAVRETAVRAPIADLTEIPSPYLSGVSEPPRNQLLLCCARGCLFRCTYCAWKSFSGGMRWLDPARLGDELRWARARNYAHAFIVDSAINFDSDRLARTARVIADAVPSGDLRFSYFLSHAHFRREQLDALGKLAPHEIWIGLESFNRDALRAIGRPPISPEQFASLLDQTSALGPASVSIILGIPGDTCAGFVATIDALVRIAEGGRRRRIASVRVFWMLVTPGTQFADRKADLEIETVRGGMAYVRGCCTFPAGDIARAMAFLFNHPRRDLFRWGDMAPAPFFPGADLPPPPSRAVGLPAPPAHAGGGAPSLLPDWGRAMPLVGSWRVERWSTREGFDTLAVTDGLRQLSIQLRPRVAGQPCYCSTANFDIVWLTDEPGASLDPSGHSVIRHVADAIRAREAGG